jgi:hypothetical protein
MSPQEAAPSVRDALPMSEAKSNYKRRCMNCSTKPTVDILAEGEPVTHTDLCGPCCFGEARMVDPKEWNK